MARDLSALIPAQEQVVDQTNHFKTAWLLFLQNLINGDAGQQASITPANLTFAGTPEITSQYYQNTGFIDFWIKITPGTSTTSTYGTTYFPLPFDVLVDDYCVAVAGLSTPALGYVDAATNRLYSPAWSAITVPVTIRGRVLAQ